MIENLDEVFEKYNKDYGKFEDMSAELKPYPRPDMCAFHILHCLLPSVSDMVVAAAHDVIWLSVDCEKLAKIAREEHIQNLCRCGVMYDAPNDSLMMFV